MMESMIEQLSLFQTPEGRTTEGLIAAGPVPGESDGGAVDELFRRDRRWRSRSGFLELLEFIARLSAYSPLNAFLIHLQDPAATRVATARMWARKYQRRLLPEARPIVILAPMSPVLFVFDIRDTEGPPLTPNTLSATAPEARPAHLLDTARHNCGIQRMAVREPTGLAPSAEHAIRLTPALRRKHAELGLEPNTRYLVLLDPGLSAEAKYASLSLELARIFCGHMGTDREAWWPDRKDLDCERIEIEAAAVAHLVCRRKGLAVAAVSPLAACIKNGHDLPPVSLNAIFQAVNHIEAISRRPWKKSPKPGPYEKI
jgi:hypothetical protein